MNEATKEPLTGELVTESEAGRELAATNEFMCYPIDHLNQPQSWDNFDGSKMERLQLALAATGPDCIPGKTMLGKPFLLKYWFIHRVMVSGEATGELTPAMRVCFINPDGQCMAFVSDGVATGLQTFIKHLGPGPWHDPLPIKVVEVRTTGARSMYKLCLDNLHPS